MGLSRKDYTDIVKFIGQTKGIYEILIKRVNKNLQDYPEDKLLIKFFESQILHGDYLLDKLKDIK